MIERCARSVADEVGFVVTKPVAKQIVIAVIKATREPTEKMAQAIWAETGDPCWKENAVKAWQAGIDAIIGDE